MALMEIRAGHWDDEHLLLPMQKLLCGEQPQQIYMVAGTEQVARAQPKMDQIGF